MSDGIMLSIGEDGIAREYDDTYDITIHCESREEQAEAIKALGSKLLWIPCSERLPTTKDDYIITVKDKSLTWTDYVEWSADYHWWGYDDDMVIAWMPLPEPYKGEERQ